MNSLLNDLLGLSGGFAGLAVIVVDENVRQRCTPGTLLVSWACYFLISARYRNDLTIPLSIALVAHLRGRIHPAHLDGCIYDGPLCVEENDNACTKQNEIQVCG